jgi:hypothetical protein
VRSLSRLPHRSSARRAAAALAAAAAVWSLVAVAAGASGPWFWAAVLVVVVACGAWVALGPRPSRALPSYAGGIVLHAGTLYATLILFLFSGCAGSTPGHVDGWMWALGFLSAAAGWVWALRRPRRTWWGLPLATFAGFVVIALLAVAVNGSTGYCES